MSKTTELCVFEADGVRCDRPRYCKDLCTGHYRQQSNGKPLKLLQPYTRRGPECLADGCTGKPHSHGYCKTHWLRLSRYGRLERVNKQYEPGDVCSINGCGKPVKTSGYCQTHYARVQRHGEPGTAESQAHTRRRSQWEGLPCKVEGCTRKPRSLGWCQMHYQRWKRTGDSVGKWGAQPRQSQGYTTTDGYRMAPERRKGRPILEHRLVMEQIIGRPLHRFEEPHHKNGIRDDNSPGNLELWVKWRRQPNGQRLDDLLAFIGTNYSREILSFLIEHCPQEVASALAEAITK